MVTLALRPGSGMANERGCNDPEPPGLRPEHGRIWRVFLCDRREVQVRQIGCYVSSREAVAFLALHHLEHVRQR